MSLLIKQRQNTKEKHGERHQATWTLGGRFKSSWKINFLILSHGSLRFVCCLKMSTSFFTPFVFWVFQLSSVVTGISFSDQFVTPCFAYPRSAISICLNSTQQLLCFHLSNTDIAVFLFLALSAIQLYCAFSFSVRVPSCFAFETITIQFVSRNVNRAVFVRSPLYVTEVYAFTYNSRYITLQHQTSHLVHL